MDIIVTELTRCFESGNRARVHKSALAAAARMIAPHVRDTDMGFIDRVQAFTRAYKPFIAIYEYHTRYIYINDPRTVVGAARILLPLLTRRFESPTYTLIVLAAVAFVHEVVHAWQASRGMFVEDDTDTACTAEAHATYITSVAMTAAGYGDYVAAGTRMLRVMSWFKADTGNTRLTSAQAQTCYIDAPRVLSDRIVTRDMRVSTARPSPPVVLYHENPLGRVGRTRKSKWA